jgi:hypothetical protein
MGWLRDAFPVARLPYGVRGMSTLSLVVYWTRRNTLCRPSARRLRFTHRNVRLLRSVEFSLGPVLNPTTRIIASNVPVALDLEEGQVDRALPLDASGSELLAPPKRFAG